MANQSESKRIVLQLPGGEEVAPTVELYVNVRQGEQVEMLLGAEGTLTVWRDEGRVSLQGIDEETKRTGVIIAIPLMTVPVVIEMLLAAAKLKP